MYTLRQLYDFLELHCPDLAELAASYNAAPSQMSPVCRIGADGKREVLPLRWGLIPSWSRMPEKNSIIARSETASESPIFRESFAQRRCLVPVSGFYEWTKTGDYKQPMYIHLLNESIFCLAGLWERWQGGGATVETFTILTTRPNAMFAQIHDRMPVILKRERFDEWLGTGEIASDCFEPFLAEEMTCYAVSSRVNSPKNNDAGLCAKGAERETLW